MFTGLVECMGTLRSVRSEGLAKRFVVEAPFCRELSTGESIAIDGVCLSAESFDSASFSVRAVPETLSRTSLARYRPGLKLNLERALRFSDRLGGHLVSGHIDCTGRVDGVRRSGADVIMRIAFPIDYAPLLVDKGSVAVDGVSLTVVEARMHTFTIALIPHTRQVTTLGVKKTGDPVHLEFDLVAKYLLRSQHVQKHLDRSTETSSKGVGRV
jgi:riboflavin synthase